MSEAEPATLLVTTPEESLDPVQLFRDTFDEMSKDVAPYLMAGLGQLAVVLPLTMVLFFVIYFGILAWMFVGMIGISLVLVAVAETLGEGAAGLASLIATVLWFGSGFALLMGFILGLGAAIAPLNASLIRRIAAYQRDGSKLDHTASFTDMKQDILATIGVTLAVGLVVSCGAVFFYLPGLLAFALLGHANYLVVLNRYSVREAMTTSARHVVANTKFYGTFWLLYFAGAMVLSYIPILGPMYLVAVHLKSHRTIFGDELAR